MSKSDKKQSQLLGSLGKEPSLFDNENDLMEDKDADDTEVILKKPG